MDKDKHKQIKKTYIDNNGYQRFTDSKRLFHRWIAEKEIFNKNKKKFTLPFEEYSVHHKDGNKLNNSSDNLEILTRSQHEQKHGLERIEWDLIRALTVAVLIMGVLWSFTNLANNYSLSNTTRIVGFVIILFLSYLVIIL